jgi:hypothetical protein
MAVQSTSISLDTIIPQSNATQLVEACISVSGKMEEAPCLCHVSLSFPALLVLVDMRISQGTQKLQEVVGHLRAAQFVGPVHWWTARLSQHIQMGEEI